VSASSGPAGIVHQERVRWVFAQSAAAMSRGSTDREDTVPLQPGNSTVQVFTLRSKYSTFFPPATYNLQFQSEYEIDGRLNQDTSNYKLTVRSPLGAVIGGGIVGALLGWYVRISVHPLQASGGWGQYIGGALTAMVIGGIAVVAFARKRDAQPFISIEDFWGGLFIGFVAGYTGNTILDSLVQTGDIAQPGASPSPAPAT